jgi:membrane protein implicated in regulation of membrane protease activity
LQEKTINDWRLMIHMTLFETITEFVGIEAPSLMEIIFVSCAVLGGILFFIMMLLMMVGDVLGGVTDAIGLDIDAGGGAFEILSVQGLSVAVMMFGLTGMFGLSATGSDVVAVLAGGVGAAAGMYGMGKMMYGINQLQADGTVNYNDAIGQRGQVYSRIKPNETGEIQVPVDGTLRTLLARAQDKAMLIPSGEFIRVVDVIGSTMIVKPLDDGPSEE